MHKYLNAGVSHIIFEMSTGPSISFTNHPSVSLLYNLTGRESDSSQTVSHVRE